MPIKLQPVYDSMEQVPESIRHGFEEKDGKAVLTKEIEVEDLPSVAGLKSTLDKTKREQKALADRLKAFDGFDAEEYTSLKSELETLRAKGSTDKGEVDRMLAQLKDGQAKELKTRDDKIVALSSRLVNREKDTAISAALTKFEAAGAGAAKAVQRLVRDSIDIVEEDGEYVTHVLDEKGKVRYSKKSGEPMTVEELVEEMASGDEYKVLFKGTGMSGPGTESNGGPRNRMNGGKKTVSKEQMQDRDFYKQMEAEAKKAGKHVTDYVNIVDD